MLNNVFDSAMYRNLATYNNTAEANKAAIVEGIVQK